MKKNLVQNISDQVKASYSAIAPEFNQTRQTPWPEFDHFLSYVRKQSKILDVGCGTGRLYGFLRTKEVSYWGIDHNPHLLDLARKNFPEVRFELGDLMDLKLEEATFDTVFCIAAFHHIPSGKMREKVLADLHRGLKNDGILILTVWNLFQWKYIWPLIKAMFRSLLTFGLKTAWNDLWIRWGNYPLKRYYHAFLPGELKKLFDHKLWNMEEFYFTRKGKRVRWLRSFNIIIIIRKINPKSSQKPE